MKPVKFREFLSKLILSGEKDVTWRLFDDKDISKGDELSLIVWETGEEFAKALVLETTIKTFAELTEADWSGHERFPSDEEMYATYSLYYKQPVNEHTPVKMIKFQLK